MGLHYLAVAQHDGIIAKCPAAMEIISRDYSTQPQSSLTVPLAKAVPQSERDRRVRRWQSSGPCQPTGVTVEEKAT